jgi:hypothetical protein
VTLSFRQSSPADGSGIVALLAEAGLASGNARSEHLHWKYWQQRRDWDGARSFVLVDGTAIIAHGGLIPGALLFGPERLQVVHMIDWAARPDAVGAGVFLMKRIGQLTDGLLSIGGSPQTQKLLPQLGFRAYGSVTGYVRTLRPLRILGQSPTTGRVVPRLARSAVWSLTAPAADLNGWEVQRLGLEQLQRLAPLFPLPRDDVAVLERSEDLLRYALTCPIVPIHLYSVEREHRVRGYFLLAVTAGQVRLADCWMSSDSAEDWCALVRCAVHQAIKYDTAAEVVIWSSDALFSRCLEDCGFHARVQHPILLTLKGKRPLATACLRVQMLDADAPYLDPVSAQLWA